MPFPDKKNAKETPRKDCILYPPSGLLGTPLPLPQSLYGKESGRAYTDVTTKISRIDGFPSFPIHGAPRRALCADAPLIIK